MFEREETARASSLRGMMPGAMKTVSPNLWSLKYYVRAKVMVRLKPKPLGYTCRRLPTQSLARKASKVKLWEGTSLGQSGERISVTHVLRNRIYSLIRTKTNYLLAEVAIDTSAYESNGRAAAN